MVRKSVNGDENILSMTPNTQVLETENAQYNSSAKVGLPLIVLQVNGNHLLSCFAMNFDKLEN